MDRRGVTIVELMIALLLSSALVAGIYRAFLTQQQSYEIQDNIMDMQQNVRVALGEMARELRMAGLGSLQSVLPVTINGKTFSNAVNPDAPSAGALTIVCATAGPATLRGFTPPNLIKVSSLKDSQDNVLFDLVNRKYVSIAGVESFAIMAIGAKDTDGYWPLTLIGTVNATLKTDGTVPVFGVRAITFSLPAGTGVLRRDGNLGGGAQPLADGIENVVFQFFDGNGVATANPPDIRRIQVTATARSRYPDSKMKVGDGYRRRQVVSNIVLRNMAF